MQLVALGVLFEHFAPGVEPGDPLSVASIEA
jgi:hypothetical protein